MAGKSSPKEFYDISNFTTGHARFELIKKAWSNSLAWDVYAGKTQFIARVLSTPIKLSDADALTLDGSAVRDTKKQLREKAIKQIGSAFGHLDADLASLGKQSRPKKPPSKSNKFAFKARIVGNPSPHDYLTDPCRMSVAECPDQVLRAISLHTTFMTNNDPSREATALPKIGDLVNVELTPNQFGYDLQFGKFLSISTNKEAGLQDTQIVDAAKLAGTSKATRSLKAQAAKEERDIRATGPVNCGAIAGLFEQFDPSIFAEGSAYTFTSAGGGFDWSNLPKDGTLNLNINPDVIAKADSLGYETWTTPYRMWFFGIRSGERQAGAFDDILGAVYYDNEGKRNTLYWQGTTDPGVYWLDHKNRHRGGTAILKEGQYIDTWKLGLHGRKPKEGKPDTRYEAFVQRGGDVAIYRDSTGDSMLNLEGSPITEGSYGINLHRSSASGGSTKVHNWSAGCQVITGKGAWEQWHALGQLQVAQTGHTWFSYTLMDIWFDPAAAAVAPKTGAEQAGIDCSASDLSWFEKTACKTSGS